MKIVIRLCLITIVVAAAACSHVAHFSPVCPHDALDDHVRQQYAIYGPQSANHEYFGFIYDHAGSFGSAVVRGNDCRTPERCVVNARAAVEQIPKGASVVGEWHTHPHGGAAGLSTLDVRGAYHNSHLNCYVPYYSDPVGDIFAWNPQLDSVPGAMHSRVLIGSYGERQVRQARNNAQHAS